MNRTTGVKVASGDQAVTPGGHSFDATRRQPPPADPSEEPMCLSPYDDDPAHGERAPAGLLHVPVRPGAAGPALRMFRSPMGGRTAVGFTRQDLLTAALGAGQSSIRL